MKIGELSEKTSVTRATIRFYERNGLVQSEVGESETNNYRDYPERNVDKLQFIGKAREAGMTVTEIRSLFDAIEKADGGEAARNVVQRLIEELTERQSKIGAVVEFLQNRLGDIDC